MKIEELINKHYSQLHENDFYILKYILNNKSTCYELGINNLADKCNVSRSSILRLAQKLGFSGYSEFRVFLKWQDQEDIQMVVSSVDAFNTDIQETLKYAKNKDFQQLCELIDNAERIFVFGTGTLQLNCADELQRMFLAMQKQLYVIRSQRELEILLPSISVEDVIIFISLSGDTPVIFPTVQTLVSKGIPFISITNLKNNRLARMTPYNLYASCSETGINEGVMINSCTPFFIIGEILFQHYVDYRKKIKSEALQSGGTL